MISLCLLVVPHMLPMMTLVIMVMMEKIRSKIFLSTSRVLNVVHLRLFYFKCGEI